MRHDLAKLTTERERYGSRNRSKKWGGRISPATDYDTLIGGFQPHSRHRNHNSKSLSDVLNPLSGALRKNIGRPWDEVYSEFCQFLDRSSMSGYHIWTHLMDFVATKTWIGDDGYVWHAATRDGRPEPVGDRWYSEQFYVDPVDGTLQLWERKISRKRKRNEYRDKDAKPYIYLTDGSYYYREDGHWYCYYKEEIVEVQNSVQQLQEIDGEVVIVEIPCHHTRVKINWFKRQIGGKELRRIRHAWREKLAGHEDWYKTPDQAREAHDPEFRKQNNRWRFGFACRV